MRGNYSMVAVIPPTRLKPTTAEPAADPDRCLRCLQHPTPGRRTSTRSWLPDEGIERACKKLDTIKNDIVWWKASTAAAAARVPAKWR